MSKEGFTTNWFPTSGVKDATDLVRKAFLYHSVRVLPKMILSKRTVSTVKSSYNQSRQELLDRLQSLDWESYVYYPESDVDFILINDQVKYGKYSEARKILLERIVKAVEPYADMEGSTVVEIGSGDGRNILFLKKRFPKLKFVGFELSDVSVELSKAAAKKFGIDDVQFFAVDATKPLPEFSGKDKVVCCYSSFALEMMPRIFKGAVDNMISLNPKSIVFFEPEGDLWSNDLRGWASKLRVSNMDRLKGLYTYLKDIERAGKWKVEFAQRSQLGINPFNEMVEIKFVKK